MVAGEVVDSIDGVDIRGLTDAGEIEALIDELRPGAPVDLVFDRAGVATTVTIEVFDLLPPFTNPGGA